LLIDITEAVKKVFMIKKIIATKKIIPICLGRKTLPNFLSTVKKMLIVWSFFKNILYAY